jgi:hypothetical protein
MKASSTSKKHRLVAASLATALACVGAALVTAAPASAAPSNCESTAIAYTITAPSNVWKATSLSSNYLRGPGVIQMSKGRTWTVSASITAPATAEANAILAKASASLGVKVVTFSAGTSPYAYQIRVPSGQVRRLQQYKLAKKFTVKKYSAQNRTTCVRRLLWTSSVTAPVASNASSMFAYALTS